MYCNGIIDISGNRNVSTIMIRHYNYKQCSYQGIRYLRQWLLKAKNVVAQQHSQATTYEGDSPQNCPQLVEVICWNRLTSGNF